MDRARCSRGHIRARGDARDAIWMPTPPETSSLGARGGLGSRRSTGLKPREQTVKKKVGEREVWTLRAGNDARGTSTATGGV